MSILSKLDDYKYWRDNKLNNYTTNLEDCLVEIDNPLKLKKSEKDRVRFLCNSNNFALFHIQKQSDYVKTVTNINAQFDLVELDKHLYMQDQVLAHITPKVEKDQSEFIPYTNKAIGWHTDGYYNDIDHRIRSFSLFCANPAISGGVNDWIDPQIAYILIREESPDMAKILTHPQALSIPEHKKDGKIRRAKSTGAIFFIDELTQQLSMRYTQRKKNIKFLDSVEINPALESLSKLLNTNTQYHFRHSMQSGQGMLCNNVVHKREAFIDDPNSPRLMLRGRYFKSIN